MNDRAHHPGERVFNRRVEFRVLAVLRRKWGLVGVAQSEVQSEVVQHLPVILYVGLVPSPPRQPTGLGLGEGGAGDRAQQEVGEGVARVGGEWRFGPAKRITAAGQYGLGGVIARTNHLVAELDGVRAFDLGEVVLNGDVVANVVVTGRARHAVANVEVGEGGAADIGHAKLFGPVLVRRRGGLVNLVQVVADAKLVVHRVAENHHVRKDNVELIDRLWHRSRIDKLGESLTGVR